MKKIAILFSIIAVIAIGFGTWFCFDKGIFPGNPGAVVTPDDPSEPGDPSEPEKPSQKTAIVTIRSNNKALGNVLTVSGAYELGSQLTLKASVNNSNFDGWFIEKTLLSKELVYSYRVEKDVLILATFSEITEEPTPVINDRELNNTDLTNEIIFYYSEESGVKTLAFTNLNTVIEPEYSIATTENPNPTYIEALRGHRQVSLSQKDNEVIDAFIFNDRKADKTSIDLATFKYLLRELDLSDALFEILNNVIPRPAENAYIEKLVAKNPETIVDDLISLFSASSNEDGFSTINLASLYKVKLYDEFKVTELKEINNLNVTFYKHIIAAEPPEETPEGKVIINASEYTETFSMSGWRRLKQTKYPNSFSSVSEMPHNFEILFHFTTPIYIVTLSVSCESDINGSYGSNHRLLNGEHFCYGQYSAKTDGEFVKSTTLNNDISKFNELLATIDFGGYEVQAKEEYASVNDLFRALVIFQNGLASTLAESLTGTFTTETNQLNICQFFTCKNKTTNKTVDDFEFNIDNTIKVQNLG